MLFGEGTGIGKEKVAEEEMDEFIWRRKGIARVGEGRKSKVRETVIFSQISPVASTDNPDVKDLLQLMFFFCFFVTHVTTT